MERPFQMLGPSHLGAVAAILAAAAAIALLVRRSGPAGARIAFRVLAGSLLSAVALYIALELLSGTSSVASFLPFHLCDMAIFVAAFALLTRHPLACETLTFWAFTGTLLAVLTPDVASDIPSRQYFFYFGLHGGVLAAAAALVFGAGWRPRPWAPLRVWLLTNLYAGMVGLVDAVFEMNYMYLCARPEQPSLLDRFGPWPVYIVVADLIGLGLFSLLHAAIKDRTPRAAHRGT